ncbi:MAG: hypothetical protein K9L68_08170 [Spirochaetales bacterium]|nr:hypothetical protein [Spirochaetales bacterium]
MNIARLKMTNNNEQNNKPSPVNLALKQFFFVVAIGITLTVIAVSVQLITTYKKEMESIDSVFAMIEDSYLPPLNLSVFHFDRQHTNLLLEGIILLRNIDYVEISESRGGEMTTTTSIGRKPSSEGITEHFALEYAYKGTLRDLGTLVVHADLMEAKARVADQAIFVAASNALLVFGVSFFILLIMHLSVVRHLRRTARFLEAIDLTRETDTVLSLNRSSREKRRPDEIDEIVEAINSMHLRLSRAYADLKSTKENLDSTLEEKNTLIQEVYHRTKNNMQVITSFLSLQGAKSPQNKSVQKLVRDSNRRIHAMSLVHEKLYQAKDLSRIQMREYLSELSRHTITREQQENIVPRLKFDIDDTYFLIDTALPCGLIVTELVSNSMKHAFSSQQTGEITIGLDSKDPEHTRLYVTDDGSGVQSDSDIFQHGGMGLQIVYSIVEQQLRGSVRIETTEGFQCMIEFPRSLYTERV